MARLAGFEPATLGLEGRCSIQLSYRRKIKPTRQITPGVLPFALRAALRAFKIAPGNFVEPATLGLAYQLRLSTPQYTSWVCGLDYLFTITGVARIVSTEPECDP